jgi:CreA protein
MEGEQQRHPRRERGDGIECPADRQRPEHGRRRVLRRSVLFKTLQVVRFFDKQRNVLVYVAYSDRVIEGSPKNSISSVPIMAPYRPRPQYTVVNWHISSGIR